MEKCRRRQLSKLEGSKWKKNEIIIFVLCVKCVRVGTWYVTNGRMCVCLMYEMKLFPHMNSLVSIFIE